MNILDVLVTQRKLKRKELLPVLVEAIKNNEYIEPIDILKDSNGRYIIENGHHRATAYVISGRDKLEDYEYNVLYADSERPVFGSIKDLMDRTNGK